MVTLTLASAVAPGETVKVAYAVPTTNPLQDAAGNPAATLTNQEVTNDYAGASEHHLVRRASPRRRPMTARSTGSVTATLARATRSPTGWRVARA